MTDSVLFVAIFGGFYSTDKLTLEKPQCSPLSVCTHRKLLCSLPIRLPTRGQDDFVVCYQDDGVALHSFRDYHVYSTIILGYF